MKPIVGQAEHPPALDDLLELDEGRLEALDGLAALVTITPAGIPIVASIGAFVPAALAARRRLRAGTWRRAPFLVIVLAAAATATLLRAV